MLSNILDVEEAVALAVVIGISDVEKLQKPPDSGESNKSESRDWRSVDRVTGGQWIQKPPDSGERKKSYEKVTKLPQGYQSYDSRLLACSSEGSSRSHWCHRRPIPSG